MEPLIVPPCPGCGNDDPSAFVRLENEVVCERCQFMRLIVMPPYAPVDDPEFLPVPGYAHAEELQRILRRFQSEET